MENMINIMIKENWHTLPADSPENKIYKMALKLEKEQSIKTVSKEKTAPKKKTKTTKKKGKK